MFEADATSRHSAITSDTFIVADVDGDDDDDGDGDDDGMVER